MHALQLLEWQLEAGADETIGDQPVNRLAAAAPAYAAPAMPEVRGVSERTKAAPAPSFGAKLAAPSAVIAEARRLADACNTLEELRAAVSGFEGLSIKKTAMNTVFADGNPKAKIVLIGEAPGAQEDQQGIPFCGPSGKLLDKMLGSIGLSRAENAYISNTTFWRPPGNRQPTPEELAACQPFVQKHIALMRPKLLILLGGTATGALLEKNISISKLRLKIQEYTNPYLDAPIATVVTFHPSYLLRSPGQKKLAWQDLLYIRQWVDNNQLI